MAGFKVDTLALIEASRRFDAASFALATDAERLRKAARLLEGQTIGAIRDDMLVAHAALEQAADAVRGLGRQERAIAEVYERTERRVGAVVAALPAGALMQAPSSAWAACEGSPSCQVQVTTALLSGASTFFSNSRLPAESWLLARAVSAREKGG